MTGAAIAAVLLFGALIAPNAMMGQPRPDFSGTWKIAESESTPPPPLPPAAAIGGRPAPPPPPRTVGLTIGQSETELRVDRRMVQGDREFVHKLLFHLDGTESVNQTGPIVSKSIASWDGSKLVISSVRSIDDRMLGDSKDIYSLDGARLVIEHSGTTPVGTMRDKSVYIRDR